MKSQLGNTQFADKLNHLFASRTRPDGTEYTHEEVHQATGITVGYISKLRTGKTENPGYKVIRALSTFFQVSPSYFFDEDAIPDAQPDQDHYLETIALRASELSEEGKRALLGMLDHISKLEGAKKPRH